MWLKTTIGELYNHASFERIRVAPLETQDAGSYGVIGSKLSSQMPTDEQDQDQDVVFITCATREEADAVVNRIAVALNSKTELLDLTVLPRDYHYASG